MRDWFSFNQMNRTRGSKNRSSPICLNVGCDKFDTRYRYKFIPILNLELVGLRWLGWYSKLTRPTRLKKKKQKQKPNQDIPSHFPSQQESKILKEIRDSSAKENTCESVIHEANISTTTSNKKKKKTSLKQTCDPFKSP